RAPSFENVPARTSTWLLRDLSSPSLYFFFQAEDGIRDRNVTGVQTCALPIWPCRCCWRRPTATRYRSPTCPASAPTCPFGPVTRSEERRVGKEGRCLGAAGTEKKKRSQGDSEENPMA